MLRGWLDTRRGIGDVVVGMAHQDSDLQLTRPDGRGWRATFYTSGLEHSADELGSARRGNRRRGGAAGHGGGARCGFDLTDPRMATALGYVGQRRAAPARFIAFAGQVSMGMLPQRLNWAEDTVGGTRARLNAPVHAAPAFPRDDSRAGCTEYGAPGGE